MPGSCAHVCKDSTEVYNKDEWAFSRVENFVDAIIAIHGDKNLRNYQVVNLPKDEQGKFPNGCTEKQWVIPKKSDNDSGKITQEKCSKPLSKDDAVKKIIDMIKNYTY